MKQYNYILLVFFLFFSSFDGFGQRTSRGIKKENFTFKMNEKTFNGSFTYSFEPFSKLNEEKVLNPGNYYFNIADMKKPRIFLLKIDKLKWDNSIPNEIKKELSLVIPQNWITEDNQKVLSPKKRSFCFSSNQHMLEYHYVKDGKGKSKISFGVKLPEQNCEAVVIKSGAFEFNYTIDSQKKYIEIPLETGNTPSETPTQPTTTTVVEPTEPEEIKWENCKDLNFPIECLNNYLAKHPEGKYVADAKSRVDSYLWEEALEKNTKASYETYLRVAPIKEHAANARQKINKLTEKAKEPVVEVKKDPIKEAWDAARKKHSASAYTNFLAAYPDSKYSDAASKYSNEIQVLLSDDGNQQDVYRLILKNVFRPKVDSISPATGVEVDYSKFNKKNGFEFVVTILDGLPHTIYFSDKTKPKEFSKKAFSIDNLLKANMESKGDSLLFTFSKGTPPYSIFFKKGNEGILSQSDIKSKQVVILKKDIKAELIDSDTLSIEAWDSRGIVGFDLKTIFIEKEKFPWQYGAGALGGLLLLYLLRSVYKNNQKKKLVALNEKRKKEQGIQSKKEVVPPPTPKTKEDENVVEVVDFSDDIPDAEIVETAESQEVITPSNSMDNLDDKSSGLKIKKVRKAHTPTESIDSTTEEMAMALDKNNYYFLPQSQHWEDTVITEIGFSKKSIHHLDKFLREQNAQSTNEAGELMEEVDGSIPEIGGLLMGKSKHFKNQNSYIVTIEEFIPINPEFNNVYKLEFSTQSLAKELGDAQDQYPELTLVGWFHTHPGHGLFLSKPDLTIHEGFFREPYQFAMEIDSRTVNFDTGFFTRRKDGQVNNREHKKLHSTWFAWTEIEKFMRQKS